jgi:hypothetical protein
MACGPEDSFNKRHEVWNLHRVAMTVANPERILFKNVSTSDDQIAGFNEVGISNEGRELLVLIYFDALILS